jgi:glycosyltransferase involved in cell wall biosynthesis
MHKNQGRHLVIIGIRGVPAAHGGFETFAERLVIFLRDRGWTVTVYCQGSDSGRREIDTWEGVNRIHIPVRGNGAAGTIEFDMKCAADIEKVPGIVLTLGYNTGFISSWLRMRGRTNLINMDGLEWKRAKYGLAARTYLWLNERLAAWSGNLLIADHPAIADHLATRANKSKIVMIPYGGDDISNPGVDHLNELNLERDRFFTVIARPEPENSILEIVKAFSCMTRKTKLVVLGSYNDQSSFQKSVLEAAGPQVVFPGPIYDKQILAALRFHSIAYIHGHQVGGTNPSLVEALGAGSAVIAHDNPYNRWVADAAALYFTDVASCSHQITRLEQDILAREQMREAARSRWQAEFTWASILSAYEHVLLHADN